MVNGFRRLVIVQGEDRAVLNQFHYITSWVEGDWITLTDDALFTAQSKIPYRPNQAKLLLGREFKHAIFDARKGFNLDALAILSGCLIAQSVLLLWLPLQLENWHDDDSLRWNEGEIALAVPNFITHLMTVIEHHSQINEQYIKCYTLTQNQADNHLATLLQLTSLTSPIAPYFNYRQQHVLLNDLMTLNAKMILVTAKRGRGKSALAGMFAHHHACIVTAPNKNAVNTLMAFAPSDTNFFAPDELIILLKTQHVNANKWLIIDEAAMIPLPLIKKLIDHFDHVLLTTTVDGYEGTGQGLLLKLVEHYQQHDDVVQCQLTAPIRWFDDDPLEGFIDQLLVANWSQPKWQDNHTLAIKKLTQSALVETDGKLSQYFGLLKAAHYRTTVVDLRRLLDAQNITLYSGELDNNLTVSVLVAVKEGGLAPTLVDQILKGYRRPKGNLVAQSLVAHAGEPLAAELHSIRINRIAVYHTVRQHGIASALIQSLLADARRASQDFVSVSFAYTTGLYQFWIKNGFRVVQVGSHQDASSGSYAIMAIYPLTVKGHLLCDKLSKKLSRNWYWLNTLIDIDLPISIEHDQMLNDDDKLELQLFATTSYAYSASMAGLCRLIHWIKGYHPACIVMLPLLTHLVENQFNEYQTIKAYELSGKKALLVLLRKEVHQFMITQGLFNE